MTRPGTRFGRYEIISHLGSGGMGEVYRARDERLGRDVAIKILPHSFADDEERVRRFEIEARAAGALNHPNLLSIFDVGNSDGTPFIVSELLDGVTLRTHLERRRMSLRECVFVATQLTAGLTTAHQQGIVHRDLKPDNIFITSGTHVKILDFGLAKLFRSVQDETTARQETAAGTVLGTPGYMAPEQVRGRGVDHRADIFSFGAILFEMLTGRRAFEGESAADTLTLVLRDDAPIADAIAVSPGLARIVERCLDRDPARRFQSAQDLGFAIDAVESSAAEVRAPRSDASTVQFRRVTFRRGQVMNARFAPDGSIVYGATWEGRPLEVFVSAPGNPEARALGFPRADVMAVHASGDLALGLERHYVLGYITSATLARVPLSGGAPRQLYEDVQDADFAPDGRAFAIVRRERERYTLEYPPGRVLFSSSGWIGSPRFSPDGRRIAFIDRPQWGDDGGRVVFIDLGDLTTAASRHWPSTSSLAWHGAQEVWLGADPHGISRDLVAVDAAGHDRPLLSVPGRLAIHDVAADGSALVSHGTARREMVAIDVASGVETKLSWFDWSFPAEISPDGTRLLFKEQVTGGVYVCGLDGSPAVQLGRGIPRAFTGDGKWVVTLPEDHAGPFVLQPVGAGEPRIHHHNLEHVQWCTFLPGSEDLVSWGNEQRGGVRLFVQRAGDTQPRPFSPEGVSRPLVTSPRGDEVIAVSPQMLPTRYSVDGGHAEVIAGGRAGDQPLQWSGDGQTLLVYRKNGAGAEVSAIDLASGRRDHWRDLRPTDPAGVLDISPILSTRDFRTLVYSYRRILNDLYVVEGLR
jgi:hypothetical protein